MWIRSAYFNFTKFSELCMYYYCMSMWGNQKMQISWPCLFQSNFLITLNQNIVVYVNIKNIQNAIWPLRLIPFYSTGVNADVLQPRVHFHFIVRYLALSRCRCIGVRERVQMLHGGWSGCCAGPGVSACCWRLNRHKKVKRPLPMTPKHSTPKQACKHKSNASGSEIKCSQVHFTSQWENLV